MIGHCMKEVAKGETTTVMEVPLALLATAQHPLPLHGIEGTPMPGRLADA